MKRHHPSRSFPFIVLLMLVLACALPAAGCASGQPASSSQPASASASSAAAAVGEPWIDSNVLGAVTKDTQANVHDDYFVAGEKDWLSTVKIPEGSESWGSYAERGKQIDDQLIALIENESITDHDVVCMRNYFKLLSDWEARNAAGIDPVMAEVREVQAISSIDELTAYLVSDRVRLRGNYIADDEGDPTGETLVTFELVIPEVGTADYRVSVGVNSRFTQSASGYDVDDAMLEALNQAFTMKASYMLGRAGYSDSEAEKMLRLVKDLEGKLEKASQPTDDEVKAAEDYLSQAMNGSEELTEGEWELIYEQALSFYEHTKLMTRDEMAASAGAFPILQIIDAYGFGSAVAYDVAEPKWLSAMGEVYNQQNLEALKAHIICGILVDNMRYLDQGAFEMGIMGDSLIASAELAEADDEGEAAKSSGASASRVALAATASADETGGVPADRVEPVSEEYQVKAFAMETLKEDMPGVVTNAFVEHCYPEAANERAIELTYQVIAEYRELLKDEEWLDPETRAAAIEKLNAVEVHVGYPSSLDDTAALVVPTPGSGASLYDASKALDAYNVELTQRLLADPSQGTYWQNPMEVNAYYSPSDNAIFIGCGIIGGRLFDENASIEEQLATLGHTIGHEVSHAFDSSGAYFDKDGNYRNWWTEGDLVEFKQRTDKVVKYLSTIKPLGTEAYNGESVCAEMIADISGLKVILMIAKDIDGFDYKKFFDAYLTGWQSVGTKSAIESQFYTDPHPLDATRANVSVMQVQEFYDTYGIKPGDKMYLAPEDRIAVW